jgi:MFS family permease
MTKKGRIVVVAGLALNLAQGVLYAWSLFGKQLAEPTAAGGFGWSRTLATLPYTAAIVCFALVMVPAGRLQDRIGPRATATAGAMLCGFGLLVASLGRAGSAWPIVAGFGLLTGAGIGLGYAAATPAAVKWFCQEKRGRVTGVVVAGVGLAPIYIAPLARAMLAAWGVAGAFRGLGLMALVLAGLAAQFLADPEPGYVPPPFKARKSGRTVSPPSADATWREMIRSPRFGSLYLQLVFGATAGLMIIGHVARIVSSQSGGAIQAGYLFVVLIAVFNAAGRVTAGWVSDIIGRVPTLVIVFIAQALVLFFFSRMTTLPGLVVGIALVGFNFGSCLSVFPAAAAGHWGTKNLGLNYGILFTAWGLGGVIGPSLAGMIADATGSYARAYQIAGGLLLLAVLLALSQIRRPAPRT